MSKDNKCQITGGTQRQLLSKPYPFSTIQLDFSSVLKAIIIKVVVKKRDDTYNS